MAGFAIGHEDAGHDVNLLESHKLLDRPSTRHEIQLDELLSKTRHAKKVNRFPSEGTQSTDRFQV
jgi:hypothetical protein